jgi:hypothetical protein
MVLYLPQLAPDVRDEKAPSSPIWQHSTEFSNDYSRAMKSALELGKKLASKDEGFKREFEMQERSFLNICSRMHELKARTDRVVKDKSFYALLHSS